MFYLFAIELYSVDTHSHFMFGMGNGCTAHIESWYGLMVSVILIMILWGFIKFFSPRFDLPQVSILV